MVRKTSHMATGNRCLTGIATAAFRIAALWCGAFVSYADTTGTVKVDSAKIREKADASSESVGGAARGTEVTITEEVTDASGTLWYKVTVDDTTGYMRSDLVDKESADGGETTQQAAQPESSASGASVEPEQAMDAQYASVSTGTAKVRTAPSTNEAIVDKLAQGTQVVISGQTNASDGKIWYYVTFTGTDGAERTGYIRSDLLSRGDMVPVPEEEIPEPEEVIPEEPEPELPDDYELIYGHGADGAEAWYLIDNTAEGGGSQYPLEQLMKVTKARSEEDSKNAKSLVRQRIVIVVMGVLMAALIVAVIIMALKLRDVYYEDYEDEDEEEEEEEPAPRRRRTQEAEEETPRRRRTQEAEEETPRRRRTQEAEEETPRRRRAEEPEDAAAKRRRRRDEEDSEVSQARPAAAPKRKTRNFLLDDDEFEFEFLNMDDKKS